jgi:anti-anti-sigma regulatory factor
MLRVTVVDSTNTTVRLRVEGRLTGRCVEELRQSCELHALAEGMQLTLDLADVSFADASGIEVLKELKGRDVTILNLMPFLALQLCDATGEKLQPRNNGEAPKGNDSR